ncbi:hypothetical protein [Streptomyces cylindrosporus]|uniref:Secreted protein n=1 Tax=Streptomyces cylindrosporus TaxID=2927583 RepID=A0ABS9YFH8_9ACTN|nr:hypothetical protein [Streptomyces cylindrosporus]MCI3274636.1 hypothetical protein [Streptomyces cylindrosporus]
MNLRLLALAGVVACAVALPLAVASAGPAGDEGRAVVRAPAREPVRSSPSADAKAPTVAPTESPLLLGLGLATAARCGPELTSPEGIEAQTCVLTQGADTWARTYYRNATGDALDSVLSLMGPEGRTVQINCAVGAGDEPGTCETPRERTRGGADAYTAFAEFAARGGRGPLLLRSGSNSGASNGS